MYFIYCILYNKSSLRELLLVILNTKYKIQNTEYCIQTIMLPKSRKITRKDFPQDFHSGYKYHSINLLLLVVKQENLNNPTRFSFVVSKKVSKSAIKRILLKRKSYNIIKNNIKYIKPGFLCIFHFKKGVENKSFQEISKEIVISLEKASVLEKN